MCVCTSACVLCICLVPLYLYVWGKEVEWVNEWEDSFSKSLSCGCHSFVFGWWGSRLLYHSYKSYGRPSCSGILHCIAALWSSLRIISYLSHLGSVFNSESAVVFAKTVNVPIVLMGVQVFPVLFSKWVNRRIGFLAIYCMNAAFWFMNVHTMLTCWHEESIAPLFLPPSLSLCFSLVHVSGFYGVGFSVCSSSYTAAPASIIDLPPLVNPLMGQWSTRFPFCHCYFVFNPFTNKAVYHVPFCL